VRNATSFTDLCLFELLASDDILETGLVVVLHREADRAVEVTWLRSPLLHHSSEREHHRLATSLLLITTMAVVSVKQQRLITTYDTQVDSSSHKIRLKAVLKDGSIHSVIKRYHPIKQLCPHHAITTVK